MKSRKPNVFWLYLLIFCPHLYADEVTHFESGVTKLSIKIDSWKKLRDSRIIKQDFDFSCGASSIATILNEFYGETYSEMDILELIGKEKIRASFLDMEMALSKIGFHAKGFSLSYENLVALKIPVIVHTKHNNSDHFSVLRGINERTVWLADPSLGNTTYSRDQFIDLWTNTEDRLSANFRKGKILVILPRDGKNVFKSDFFTKSPVRQTNSAVTQLGIR